MKVMAQTSDSATGMTQARMGHANLAAHKLISCKPPDQRTRRPASEN